MAADKTQKVAKALDKVRRKVAPGYRGFLLDPADEFGAGYVAASSGEGGELPGGWTPLNRIGDERLQIRMAPNGDLTRDRIVAAAALALLAPGASEALVYDILAKTPSQIPVDREWLLDMARTAQTFSPAGAGRFGTTDAATAVVTV